MNQSGGCHLLPCYLFRRICYPSIIHKAELMVPVVVAGLMTLVWIFRGFLTLVRPRGARYLEFQTHPNRNLHRCSYQNLPKRYFENSVLDRKNRYQSATFRHFYLWNEIETTPLLLAAKHHFWQLFRLENQQIVRDCNLDSPCFGIMT